MNRILFMMFLVCFSQFAFSQQKEDSVIVKNDSLIHRVTGSKAMNLPLKDTVTKKKHSPRTAAIRSAILPGWGQVYNKKYWKLPIVYGALGTTAVVFNFNLTQYKDIRFAYRALISHDTGNYKNVKDYLQPFIEQNAVSSLRDARNEVRRNIDYSVLVFLLFWGLNVVDATVDAHLKGFDISSDLSLKIRPGYNPGSNTTGLSLVFDVHKERARVLNLP